MRRFLIIFILIISVANAMAAEITYTSRAQITGNDVRAAQKNSLNNALLGGIRKYIQDNAPDHKGEVNTDYFMFIDSYAVISRDIVNNYVQTTVRIALDEAIHDDVSLYMPTQMNSAVFFISGLPTYLRESDVRDSMKLLFDEYQFSTNDQLAFEQEIVDKSRRQDIVTAFQAVSSQYMFELKFDMKSYKAGEYCTLATEASYMHSENFRTVPILSTEVTVEHEDIAQCAMVALNTSIDTVLAHLRDKLVAAPGVKRQEYTYELRFENISDMLPINNIMDTLQRRRLVNSHEVIEFYGEEAVFSISCFLEPDDLVARITALEIDDVDFIDTVTEESTDPAAMDDTVSVVIQMREAAE